MPFILSPSSCWLIWVFFLTHPFVPSFGWWDQTFPISKLVFHILLGSGPPRWLCIAPFHLFGPTWDTVLPLGLCLGMVTSFSSGALGVPWLQMQCEWLMPVPSSRVSCLFPRAPSHLLMSWEPSTLPGIVKSYMMKWLFFAADWQSLSGF